MNPIFSAVYSSMTPGKDSAFAGSRLSGAELQDSPLSAAAPDSPVQAEKWLRAIESGDLALDAVPEQYRTPAVCLKAVAKNGLNLKHVPKDLRTKELCREAVRSDPAAAKFVPEKYRKGPKAAMRKGAKAVLALMAAIAAEAKRRNDKKREELFDQEMMRRWKKMMKETSEDLDKELMKRMQEQAWLEARRHGVHMPIGMQMLSYVSAAKDFFVDALKRNRTVDRLFGPFEHDPSSPCAGAFAAAADPGRAAPVHGGVPDMLSALAGGCCRQAEQEREAQEEERRNMLRPSPHGGRKGFNSIG